MGNSLDGRVAVVTGAGAGLGRAEAIGLAAEGASVVVNDLQAALDASDVIDTITAAGGRAIPVPGDISESATASAIMAAATDQLGSLDIVVNNAGVVRDKMLFNMTDDEWDLVIRVHLRGHFLLNRNAGAHWRAASKAAGGPVYGRIINTSSEAGLLGPEGQANYGAAKAGITALTLSASRALKRYGVRANAICPRARTAMTAAVFGEAPADGVDPLDPAHVVRLVTYLAGPDSDNVTGQVFVVYGPKVTLMAAPTIDEVFTADGDAWDSDDLAKTLTGYFADRDPGRTFSASALMN
ncbi:3-oxoacyl-ACP reductase [Gordonia paraffinivorans]|uniref:Oxidoreductase n=2 Tax=Gordonia paraffinivorans TaxID=175628 RepID=A0ABQ0IPJ6_9ACTN|nr:3-oxoacyl-ACP reductase [Gordonia paraffinivorans]MBY4573529.1 3-oxoacyl-ACP reductase [Gordonia paraffinivorans]MCD2147141.1 3-oxoacyl-ACP reductase [Gordonia paraffinivorans]PWD42960.1 3-oxoacyl-ACP reductase [Gordonia paraffinivorans]VFA88226.1 Putative short-chain type dehydrogenase/reductase Rv0148 [Gordonia paraffinivorans]GAC85478.1 putative oxidoreductase [Gordonia paraffinivorans NBRC 108238]